MTKAEVLDILNSLKDKPFMVIFNEGTRMYSGIDDFYLFAGDKSLIQVCKNANPYEGTAVEGFTQQNSAYKMLYGDYDEVNIIITFGLNTPKEVMSKITGLAPVGTSKTLDDIKKLIEADKIFSSNKQITGYSDHEKVMINQAYTNMTDKEKRMIDEYIKNQ